ncbi:MAG: hypothetical protein ABI905_03435 [Betaproteobacteria bacterium]
MKSTHSPPGPLRHPGLVAVWLALVSVYLIASALGQRVAATAAVGLMIGALIAVSGRVVAGILVGALLAGLCVYFSGTLHVLFYAPPLAAFAFMAVFFYRTLSPGSDALITQVARMEHPDLPADMVRYTRTLTWIWAACFLLLFIAASLLAPLLAVDTWSRLVHGLGYCIPAALFLGEYAYRHVRFPDRTHGSLLVLIPNIVTVSREIATAGNGRGVETPPGSQDRAQDRVQERAR